MENLENSLKMQELINEVQILKIELDQANSAKAQSAECGLALLQENTELNKKYSELKILYERTSQELEITQKALVKMETTHRIVSEEGVRLEESLLNESYALEISLNLQIQDIESELRQVQRELKTVMDERNDAIKNYTETVKEKLEIEGENRRLKSEIKELKQNEQNLRKKYIDLEKDFDCSQKQICNLKSYEAELETSRSEIERLKEEAAVLQSQAEEFQSVSTMAEKRIAELEAMLEYEQEDKMMLKKELDMYRNPDSLSIITTNLAESIRIIEERESTNPEQESPTFTRLEENTDCGKIELLSKILQELKSIGSHFKSLETSRSSQIVGQSPNPNWENKQNELFTFMTQLSSLTNQVSELKNNFEKAYKTRSVNRTSSIESRRLSASFSDLHSKKTSSKTFTYSVPDIFDKFHKNMNTFKKISHSEIIEEVEPNTFLQNEFPNTEPLKHYNLNPEVTHMRSNIITDLDDETDESNLQEIQKLQEEIANIRDVLSDRRRKILILSHFINSDNNTDGSDIRFRTRCESDIRLNRETLYTLRDELKTLKEEIVKYLNLGVLITDKCEHISQVEDINKKLEKMEEERKELNQKLQQEAEEKAVLKERLRHLEIELQHIRRRKKKLINRCWKVITCSSKLPKDI